MQHSRKTHKYSCLTPHMKRYNGKLRCVCSENTVVNEGVREQQKIAFTQKKNVQFAV
jgi:hypothetical protein